MKPLAKKMKKKWTIFQNVNLTIIPKIKKKILHQTAESILSHFLNKRNQTNSLMKTWKKRIFNHQNLLDLPIEITGGKMKKPSRMSIHYHSYPNPSINSKELNISLNRMCIRDMTMNASKM